jgi:IS1 family transposase
MALIKVKTGGVDNTTNLGRRNLVINGDMQVTQRGDSTGVTVAGYYGPDRFQTVLNGAGTWSVSQSSTAPDGFGSSFKFDCTTADASLSTGDYFVIYYTFEGQDLQRLKKGTSSAEKSTLSFWIRSNKTGTYQVNMQDQDNSRLTGKTYTIDAANTWERKVITFDGDTTGAYTNDANASLNLEWWFAASSTFTGGAVPTSWGALAQADRAAGLNVNLADSTSNELYITGIQLEVGDTATPFEHRSFGEELSLCQRYFQRISGGSDAFTVSAKAQGVASVDATIPLTVPLRASPTMNSINSRLFNDAGYSASSSTTPTTLQYSDNNTLLAVNCGGFSGLVNNEIQNWGPVSNELTIDAEL